MPIALDQLPDDVDALKSLVADQLARNAQLESRVVVLQEQLALALARRYAASSEKCRRTRSVCSTKRKWRVPS